MGNTTYMSVFAGGTEQVVFGTPRTSLSIYWGSIDPGNQVSVTIDGYTLTGADLASMAKGTDDGSHTSPTSNELVTISGLDALHDGDVPLDHKFVRVQPWLWRSGAFDLGDDGPRFCRARLRRVPSEHEGSGVGDLIASPPPNICEGPPRGGSFFLRWGHG